MDTIKLLEGPYLVLGFPLESMFKHMKPMVIV